MARKYFFSGETENDIIKITGEEYHHLIVVMRSKTGDDIVFTDGKGTDYKGVIGEIKKDYATINIIEKKVNEDELNINFLVCAGLMKGDKNEFVIQKCAELGASDLMFFESEFCVVKAKDNKQDRYNRISLEASKQSGRSTIMNILPTVSFKNMVKILSEYDNILCAYEKGGERIDKTMLEGKKTAIIIGSEGGFSEKEINYLKDNLNVKIVSLGKRILRAETAVVTLTSIIMHEKGEI